jgi:hypothetical protein
MAETIFSGKQTREYWNQIFSTGKAQGGNPVMLKSLNFQEMIKEKN